MTEKGADVIALPRGCANELFVSLGEAVDSVEEKNGRVTGFLFIVFGEKEGHPLVVQNFSVTDLLRAAGAIAALQADIVDEERSHECPERGA